MSAYIQSEKRDELRGACAGKCPYAMRTERGMVYSVDKRDRKLKDYSFYCTAGKRPRKVAGAYEWTGTVPKWCPRLSNEEGT